MSAGQNGQVLVAGPRWGAAALAAWAGFCAWCVSGFPPSIDLAAHAAQMQTLTQVLQGNPQFTALYEAHLPAGYGLPIWLMVPAAWLFDGAVAARFAMWATLVMFPLAHAALARAFDRSTLVAVLAAPLAFNLSYWFGFLPTLFALPWVLLGWAVYWRGLGAPRLSPGRTLCLLGIGLLTILSHFVAFAALAAGVAALALSSPHRRRAVFAAGVMLGPPLFLCAGRVATLLGRTSPGTGAQALDYDAMAHLNWIIRHAQWEDRVGIWVAIVTTTLFAVSWWGRRTVEPRAPVALACAMVLLYVATPKSFSGAWLVHARLPVLIAFTGLLVVDVRTLPRFWSRCAALGAAASLVAIGWSHVEFKREVAGLAEVIAAPPPPGLHTALLLDGVSLPGHRLNDLEHLPSWWTAMHAGVGNQFFADADHLPVRYAPGARWLDEVDAANPATLAPYSAVLVYAAGDVPDAISKGFREVKRAGPWHRLER